MAQHDYVIANASGATVRADINSMALAISSNNSGSSEPSTKYAYEFWVDSGNNLIKLRNGANNAWITLPLSTTASNTVDINGGAIDGTPIGASSASTGAFTTFTSNGIDDNADAIAITIDSSEKVTLTGDLALADSKKALFGTLPDLEIFHDGSDSYIKDVGAGNFLIQGSDIYMGNTSSNHALVIRNDGKVGLGVTSPQQLLHTHIASSGSAYHQFTNSATGATSSDGWLAGINANEDFEIYGQESSENFRIYNNGGYRFVVDNNGAVQIGNPDTGAGGSLIVMPTAKLYLDAGGDTYIQESSGNVIDVVTGGGRRLRVNSNGLIFGTDTAAANALDDYEEGNWTPTIISTGGSTPNYATSLASGTYTKIGNTVCASFIIVVSGVTDNGGAGNKAVTGLPFSQTGSTYAQNGVIGYNDVWADAVQAFYITGANLQIIPTGVTQSNYTGVITTGYFSGTITYKTAA